MTISEIIVGFWFVPVVLFIVIPLGLLCVWSAYSFLRKAADSLEQACQSAKVSKEGKIPTLRSRPAI